MRVNPTSLAARIRAARLDAGFSQRVLAELLGVSRWTVIQWEAGRMVPRTPQARRLREVLGVVVEPEGAGDLASVRRRAGLTQPELAELLGVSRGKVSNIEIGRSPISDDLAERWRRVCESSITT